MRYISLLSVSIFLVACGSGKNQKPEKNEYTAKKIPYDLAQPTERHKLNSDLQEISGLGWYANGQLACVQDEAGKVFVFDIEKDKIINKIKFGEKGDYEGVERVGDEVFVLRSDGLITAFKIEEPEMRTFDLGLSKNTEVEGLGYDTKTNRLMIAVKESKKDGKIETDVVVYTFDLKRKAIWKGLVIPKEALDEFETSIGLKPDQFKPSGVAIHPLTSEIYLLASAGNRLVVIDRNGQLVTSVALSQKLLKQPEGICFAPDGTLYIASEARDKGEDGYILRFNMIPI